ncbi:MAG: TetR/AcrR family transcriptional regulator [Deltaproteobacteria bacterium]|jgi:AcrR family transcriptional regulator|nr:TetR/AcrR family transcriptional regulator [Deltaproteobacteria bacterium]
MPPKVKFEKESILNAAYEVVRQNGWEGLSSRSIARELNSSTGPIYSQLKSMKNIEEEVLRKAWALFEVYTTTSITGDKWIDQGIGHLYFAKAEGLLYKVMFDGKHHQIPSEIGQAVWDKLAGELSDYPPFKDLSEGMQLEIRSSRWIFNHGLASLITNTPEIDQPEMNEETIAHKMKRISMAIFRGVTSGPEPTEIDFFDGKKKED